MVAASFLLFLALFVAIGVSSYRLSRKTSRDYLLAGQNVPPWLVGLSAVATNNSGYMFIGVIGYTYSTGLPAVWLMVGWIVGDYLASSFIHPRLRTATAAQQENTFPGMVANWFGQNQRSVRFLGGAIAIAFLGAYTAAQLTAGSKALHVLFGWQQWIGAAIGAGIVLAYCAAGGIRASIWTDAAQSFVMITAMAILLVVAVVDLGGPSEVLTELDAAGPHYLDWFPHGLGLGDPWGPALFVVGWMFAGFSVVGQPHIMVRFMALDREGNMGRARAWYYGWFVLFYLFSQLVGLISRVMIPASGFDAELALPRMAEQLLPAPLVGLMLAGIFAATISTADSMVLACSASLTDDLFPERGKENVWVVKGGTVLVIALALAIALLGSDSVFVLVIASWAVLGAVFGPLLAAQALGWRPRVPLALTMMLIGLGAVYAWRAVPVLSPYYAGAGAIVLVVLVFLAGRALGGARRERQQPPT